MPASLKAPEGPSKAQPTKMENALEVGEEHLDFLPSMPAPLVGRRSCDGTCDITAVFVEIARDLAAWRVRAADGFWRANRAIFLAGAVAAAAILLRLLLQEDCPSFET